MIQKIRTSVAPFQIHAEHPYAVDYNEAKDAQSLLSTCIDDGNRLKQLFDLYSDTILYGTAPAKEAAGWLLEIIQKDFSTLLTAVDTARDQLSS